MRACWASGCRCGRRAGRRWADVGARGVGRERAGRVAWARGARGLDVPVHMVGMLAGSAGPVWVLMNLAQF